MAVQTKKSITFQALGEDLMQSRPSVSIYSTLLHYEAKFYS